MIFYRSWKNKRILLINDLLDLNGDLLSYVEFQTKFGLQTNFLVFEGIVKSIKNYIFIFGFAPFLYKCSDASWRPCCVMRWVRR